MNISFPDKGCVNLIDSAWRYLRTDCCSHRRLLCQFRRSPAYLEHPWVDGIRFGSRSIWHMGRLGREPIQTHHRRERQWQYSSGTRRYARPFRFFTYGNSCRSDLSLHPPTVRIKQSVHRISQSYKFSKQETFYTIRTCFAKKYVLFCFIQVKRYYTTNRFPSRQAKTAA